MIDESTMYWLTRMDYLHGMVLIGGNILTVASTLVGAVMYGAGLDRDDEQLKSIGKRLFKLVPVWLAVVLLSCFIPTTKEMVAIVVVPKIVNNEKVAEVENGLYTLAVEWMEELRPRSEDKEPSGKDTK